MEIPEVTTLPMLDQSDYPALPEIPAGKALVCFDTEWQNTEKEFAAGCIVNACMLARKWQPVRAEQFMNCVEANSMIGSFLYPGVASALWFLVNDGFIKAVRYQDANYFVPTPRLANAVLFDSSKLRLV